jgi:hypothetical protein
VSRRPLSHAADLAIVLGVAAAVLILITGGGTVPLAGTRLSFRSVTRPLVLAAIGVLLRVLGARRARRTPSRDDARRRGADVPYEALGFLTILAVTFGLALAWQVRACGGLDSYGYLSAASAIAAGQLVQPEPLAAILPFDSAIRALAPLGYVPAPSSTAIVPRFPLGFPLLLAPFLSFGLNAAFMVPVITAVVLVWMAWRAARERGSWIDGALAATFVATDAVLFNQAIQPMSDVPAAMWMVMAAWCAVRDRPRPLVSGLAAGMAVFTRPALLIAALVTGGAIGGRSGTRAFARWALGASVFIAAHGVAQYWLYGHPLASGYGSAEHLFQFGRAPDNLANYARWLFVAYGALLVLVAAPLMLRSSWAWILFAVAAAAAAPYLFYVKFDDWEVTRFLLPGSTLLLIAGASAVSRALARVLPERWVPAAALAVGLLVAARSYGFLTARGVPRLAQSESKYPAVGAWFLEHSPADSIAISSLHSGSIRFYSGRKTVRWDEIPVGRLTETVRVLRAHQHTCYLALDGPAEEDLFRSRFGAELLTMTEMPAARLRGGLNILTLDLRR